jgi:hypothetical protein
MVYYRWLDFRDWISKSNIALKAKPELWDAMKSIASKTYQRQYVYGEFVKSDVSITSC